MNKKKGCLRTEKSVSRMHRWPFELNGRVGGGDMRRRGGQLETP